MTRLDFHKWLIDFTLYDEKIKSIHIQKVTQVTEYIEIIYKFGITNIFGRHFNHVKEYPELKLADYGDLKEEIKNWREEIERARNY